jgi:hypothetical protein
MEKYYFIEKNGAKQGPYKLNDLREQTIYFDQLIWRSDSDQWKKASDFEELSGIYIVKPPPTPKEQNITEVNKEFTRRNIGGLVSIYVISSFLLGIISYNIALSSWEGSSINRYHYYSPGRDTETMYGNNEEFWFRPFKAIGSTIYLSKEEQEDSNLLERNLILSSFASLSFIFCAIGIIYYTIKRNGSNGNPINTESTQ